MKSPLFLFLAGSLLIAGVTSRLNAQQGTLHSNPVAKDLGQPANPAALPATANPVVPELKLVAQFDKNGDQHLDATERQAARAFLAAHPAPDSIPTPPRPGQPVPLPIALETVKPGDKIAPTDAAVFSKQSLYDPKVVRTLFLQFDDTDWEAELAEFARTDVSLPARLTMDGRDYAGIGVHFRPQTTAVTRPPGYKRSLDLALDYTDASQQIAGQHKLRLVAAPTDPTFLRTMLYDRVAKEYLPSPKANFVRLVINGENWGIYTSVQPLDENFLKEHYHGTRGALWVAPAGGNLAYLGDDPAPYRNIYQLQTPDDPAAWARLIALCKAIDQAEHGQLEVALAPYLDIDNAVRFFALQNALINLDGYGSTNGSYGLYLDPTGHFHLIPQDAESSLRLVQVTEYGKRQRGGVDRGQNADAPDQPAAANDTGKPKGKEKAKKEELPSKPLYDKKNFPRQSGTDLAMLLSYSFVNKADADFDGKVSHDEWLAFARAWFFAMDEDQAGHLTRDQFIAKVRQLVTPTSITDGRTHQTFGKDDPAVIIGGDLFTALDGNHDGQLTLDEFTDTFTRWFTQWSDPRAKSLTQESLQSAFNTLFSKSVFLADQTYIKTRDGPKLDGDQAGGPGNGGGRGSRGGRQGGGNSDGAGGNGGAGLSLGPIHLGGLGGHKGGIADTSTIITYGEELDSLAGLDDPTKPLLSRILAAPPLRSRYLGYLHDITEDWVTWAKLGPIAKEYHTLIAADVMKDTHKPASYEKFVQEFDQDTTPGARESEAAPSLKGFIDERGKFLSKDDTVNGHSGW